MPEILTESFCERCGTRYTFESAQPTPRMKSVKVLGRGLRHFVMSDGSSIDEAMAAARADTDRESVAHQLDAFHETFNFCMSCRQYTCSNCWNTPEGRCLSCAPVEDVEPVSLWQPASAAPVASEAQGAAEMPAATEEPAATLARITDLEPATEPEPVTPVAAPAVEPGIEAAATGIAGPADRTRSEGRDLATAAALAAADDGGLFGGPRPVDGSDRARRGATPEPAVVAAGGPADEAPVDVVEPLDIPADHVRFDEDLGSDADIGAQATDADDFEPIEEVDAIARLRAMTEPTGAPDAALGSAATEIGDHDGSSATPDATPGDRADADLPIDAPAQAAPLSHRFQPGDDLDAQLAAYERDRATALEGDVVKASIDDADQSAETAATATAHEPSEEAAAIVALESEPDELIRAPTEAAAPATEPVELTAEPGPTTEPVELSPEPDQPAIVPVREDVVVQPTWTPPAPIAAEPSAPSPAEPSAPSAAPEWPSRPSTGGLPFLGRPAAPQGGIEALWAASSQDVVRPAQAPGAKAAGVQPCISCGLSLSANARFCRRCGTAQTD